MAFYAVRGVPLDQLVGLSGTEKAFLRCAREAYYKEIGELLSAMAGQKSSS